MKDKKGQMFGFIILGILALLVMVAYFSESFRYFAIGGILIALAIYILSNKELFKKNDKLKVLLFIGLLVVGLISIFTSSFLQEAVGGSNYIEVPSFATIECQQSGTSKSFVTGIPDNGAWMSDSLPDNTNEWTIRIKTDDFGFFSTGKRIEYYSCNSRSFSNCEQTFIDVNQRGDDINFGTFSRDKHIWMQFQSISPTNLQWEGISGGNLDVTYKPFVLVRDDVFRGGRQELTESIGCTIPSNDISWINRVTGGTLDTISSTGDRSLEPGEKFNYVSTTIVSVMDGNTQNGGWCIYENGQANVYEIETLEIAGSTKNVINFDRVIDSNVECCEKGATPNGYVCQDGILVNIDSGDLQCSTRADCGSLEWNRVIGQTKTVQRALCDSGVCGFEQREVDCTLDSECMTNQFCDRNTFTCKDASEQGSGEDRPGDTAICKYFWQTEIETGETHYSLWNYFGIGEPEVVPVTRCDNTLAWIFAGTLIIIVAIIGGVMTIRKPKRRRRKK